MRKWTTILLLAGAAGCSTPVMQPTDTAPLRNLTANPVDESKGEITVLVLGSVHKTGFFSFREKEPCTMMHLLLKMGGLPPYTDPREATVYRRNADGTDEKITVNVKELMESGDPSKKDFPLKTGDRIVFRGWLLAN